MQLKRRRVFRKAPEVRSRSEGAKRPKGEWWEVRDGAFTRQPAEDSASPPEDTEGNGWREDSADPRDASLASTGPLVLEYQTKRAKKTR